MPGYGATKLQKHLGHIKRRQGSACIEGIHGQTGRSRVRARRGLLQRGCGQWWAITPLPNSMKWSWASWQKRFVISWRIQTSTISLSKNGSDFGMCLNRLWTLSGWFIIAAKADEL